METLEKTIEGLERWHKVRERLNKEQDRKPLVMETLPNVIEHLKAYRSLLEHPLIQGNEGIRIPFSETDLQDLQNGETFDWTFNGIDVHLFQGEEEDL